MGKKDFPTELPVSGGKLKSGKSHVAMMYGAIMGMLLHFRNKSIACVPHGRESDRESADITVTVSNRELWPSL